jgi:hypothetical protein
MKVRRGSNVQGSSCSGVTFVSGVAALRGDSSEMARRLEEVGVRAVGFGRAAGVGGWDLASRAFGAGLVEIIVPMPGLGEMFVPVAGLGERVVPVAGLGEIFASVPGLGEDGG